VVVLVISAWLARAAGSSVLVLFARSAWYLVVSLVPVSLGLALLRARLYDRAALIRRAIIYGLLTAGLALVYFGGMGEFPALFGLALSGAPRAIEPGASLYLSNLLSILIMALLFQPLRHLLQTAIDRRFYRRLSDTARGFATFAGTVHEEIHVASLGQRVLALLQATLHPCAATLWVRLHLAEDAAALPAAIARRASGQSRAPAEQPIELYRLAPGNGATAERATLALLPDDPLRTALVRAPWPVALACVPASSPAASGLRAADTSSAVPLLDRGDLVGLIALSDHPHSFDLRELVAALGTELAPALRVAQLIHEQEVQARQRERVEQELELARRIQQSFLPRAVPSLDGWQITSHYRPAREVGGDFYDFLVLADGRLGLIVGDVTDKGVPAALVMAATRSMLRAAAQQQGAPGAVLRQVNDLLDPDVPAGMFVTCFYAILDPATGHLRYANAGHELPYHRHENTVKELYARGMPLGLMPAMRYEEGEAVLQPGDTVLLYSDGLVEAHDHRRDMFGRARLARLIGDTAGDTALIDHVLAGLSSFTQPDWEQEDDITLVTLHRRGRGSHRDPDN
jgi:serine phosphatase RsbU (regulator of sigma subunit)